MLFKIVQVTFFILLLQALCAASRSVVGNVDEKGLFPNQEHKVFTEIGTLLRTEALVANPNGMSCFLAYIDQGSHVFHGTFIKEARKGHDWLAFDPNFAANFARMKVPGTSIPQKPPIDPPSIPSQHQNGVQHAFISKTDESNAQAAQESIQLGNLRTFTTKYKLRLMYLDGVSGLKRVNGSLDFQDAILLYNNSIPPLRDDIRSDKLCELRQNRWKNKIDGFVRKNGEFELLICDFEKIFD